VLDRRWPGLRRRALGTLPPPASLAVESYYEMLGASRGRHAGGAAAGVALRTRVLHPDRWDAGTHRWDGSTPAACSPSSTRYVTISALLRAAPTTAQSSPPNDEDEWRSESPPARRIPRGPRRALRARRARRTGACCRYTAPKKELPLWLRVSPICCSSLRVSA
jgi:hypothetical protein